MRSFKQSRIDAFLEGLDSLDIPYIQRGECHYQVNTSYGIVDCYPSTRKFILRGKKDGKPNQVIWREKTMDDLIKLIKGDII